MATFSKDFGSMGLWHSWKEVRQHNWQLPESTLVQAAYRPGNENLLLICIAEKGRMLDWKLLWQREHPAETAAMLYIRSAAFDLQRRQRIQEKVYRFIASANLWPFKKQRWVLPTSCKGALRTARMCIRGLAQTIAGPSAPYGARFIEKQFTLYQGRNQGLLDRLDDHHRAAHEVTLDFVTDLNAAEVLRYENREDVRWLPYNVRIPGQHNQRRLDDFLHAHSEKWLASLDRLSLLPPITHTHPTP
jgi:hypothetical protein